MVLVLKLRLRNFLMLEQCIPLEGKMIWQMRFNHTIFRYKRYINFHMDEKLGIRFQKMQKCKIIHILHFCLRKEVKIYLMQASTESELCIPSED